MTLRGTVLFLLATLLLNILIERKISKTEAPVFIVLSDNSSSMLNYQDSAQVMQRLKSLKSDLTNAYDEDFDFVFLNVDDSLNENATNFKGVQSELHAGFEYIFNQYYNRNIGGIAFISDGNYNKGIDPVYAASKIPFAPVFTFGVGDTILKRDQLIRSVDANSVAFLGNDFPIELTIESKRFKGKKAKLALLQSGKEIASKTLEMKDEHSFISEQFQVKASSPGLQSYEVRLEVLEGESSSKNNSRRIYVEVLDTRSKVLLLASAPHPDVAAIKSALEGNDRVELQSVTSDKFDGNLKDIELVIAHGLKKGKSEQQLNAIEKAGIPCWYILSSTSDVALLNKRISGGSIPSANRFDNVLAYENESFQLFEKSEDVAQLLKTAPPIYTRFGEFNGSFGDVWIKQRIGPVKKKDPVLSFKDYQGRKCAFLFGEGIWRWKLNEYVRTQENKGFNTLVQNTVQYLTVKRNNDPLRVYLPENFTSEEEIVLKAEFYNEALEAITSPSIDLKLVNENGKSFQYRFSPRRSDYSVNLGKHKPGAYSYEVRAQHNGKSYLKKGMFVIEELTIESLSTHADFGLLRKLSNQSNGTFYTLANSKRFISDLRKRDDIVAVNYSESKFSHLIDLLFMMLLCALLLTCEWFVRRYSGGY